MKILVFSDSHGRGRKIAEAIEAHSGICDAVIFLGDGISELDYVKKQYPDLTYFAVRGNCDLFAGSPESALIDIDGIKIYISHGHRHSVKTTYDAITAYGAEIGADAVFFGHTHIPYSSVEYVGERRIQLFNPGSIGMGGSYGVINTVRGALVTGFGSV